jgi:carboxyl-terminal processing protease
MVLTKAINCSHSSNSLSQDNQATYQDGIATDIPLAVVVNGNTASAAEVMTAALKENKRATIVGEQTFGKGIIRIKEINS